MNDSAFTRDTALAAAESIRQGFDALTAGFAAITARARRRFEQRDWHGGQEDALERLGLYPAAVDDVVTEVRRILGAASLDHGTWARLKAGFSASLSDGGSTGGRCDAEIAETFFNSVTRKFFATVGVDPEIQYVDSDFERLLKRAEKPIFKTHCSKGGTRTLIEAVLRDVPIGVPYRNLGRDAGRVAERIDEHLRVHGMELEAAEILHPVFYRGKGAYVVGRLRSGVHNVPLVLPLLHEDGGAVVDAVLLDPNEVSIVFSFTRSYFHVEAEKPREIVDFLRSIMPNKRVAELYIALGYNKHGKTELYRDLWRHVNAADDRFEAARGDKGMVMMVFTMPSFDLVFKIIRDTFAYPKTVTRREVRAKYHLVFIHDRVGRLVDAQEFEHLKIRRDRFDPALLEELLRDASYSVAVEGDDVMIKHVYVERRLKPLNLYLREVGDVAACEAVVDYGNAIKDLVSANIFPGDIMLKNFGVTRHGRVVFYDYDELCLITDCNFRDVPEARDHNEELYAETYYHVGENDVFPEEFKQFLGLQDALRDVYIEHHGDLFSVAFWHGWQGRLRAGEVADVFPYKQSRRLGGMP